MAHRIDFASDRRNSAQRGLVAARGRHHLDRMGKRLAILWNVVRGDARRLWFAVRHPAAPAWLKVASGLIVLYLLSPIDLIPEAIPLLGVVDDIVLVPLAMRWLLARLPEPLRADVDRRFGPRLP